MRQFDRNTWYTCKHEQLIVFYSVILKIFKKEPYTIKFIHGIKNQVFFIKTRQDYKLHYFLIIIKNIVYMYHKHLAHIET